MYRIIEFFKTIIEAFRRSKSGGGPAQQKRRREMPPRCPICREFLAKGEEHDHDDDEADERDDDRETADN